MISLAFMCTGRGGGWDPLCNGSHLALLVFIAVGLAVGTTVLFGRGRSAGTVVALGVFATIVSFFVTFGIGFALG